MIRPIHLLAPVALLVLHCAALADDPAPFPQSLAGEWQGSIPNPKSSDDEDRISIAVTIENFDSQAKESGVLHYGAPRFCTLSLRFSSLTDSKLIYDLTRPSAAACATLDNGRLVVTKPDPQTGVGFHTRSSAHQTIDTGSLTRPIKAP